MKASQVTSKSQDDNVKNYHIFGYLQHTCSIFLTTAKCIQNLINAITPKFFFKTMQYKWYTLTFPNVSSMINYDCSADLFISRYPINVYHSAMLNKNVYG